MFAFYSPTIKTGDPSPKTLFFSVFFMFPLNGLFMVPVVREDVKQGFTAHVDVCSVPGCKGHYDADDGYFDVENGFVANPEGGNPIWYLDAPEDVQENRYPLNTCLLRGWIEELDMGNQSYKGYPVAQPFIPKGGSFDDFSKPPYYRLTTAGWNALNRSYAISRIALLVSAVALVVSLTNVLRKTEPPTLKVVFPAPSVPSRK